MSKTQAIFLGGELPLYTTNKHNKTITRVKNLLSKLIKNITLPFKSLRVSKKCVMSLKEVSYAQQGCVYLIKKQKYYKLHNSFCINIIQNVIYFCDGKAEFLAAITCMYTVLLLKVNIRAKHQK